MRIVNSVLGDATGGRWQVVCDYSRVLEHAGHQVLMLLGQRQRDLRLVPSGVAVETVRNRGHYDYLAAWRAARRLRLFAPDVALAHCSRSVALLKRALAGAAPLVAVSHSNKVRRLLPADACIALTAHIRRRFERESAGASRKPCFVVPNMIALDPARQLPAALSHRPVRIVALGRFDRVKGFDVFLRALAKLRAQDRELTATLGGTGSEERQLRRLAKQLGLQGVVHFPGWVEDVTAFLSEADLLCVPARSDAFGLTPLQGAAAGVPLVLSRASGHREMFEQEREALFCDTGDPHSTAHQMARLMDNSGLATQLRRAAFERTRRCYSVPAVTAQLLRVLETVHKSRK